MAMRSHAARILLLLCLAGTLLAGETPAASARMVYSLHDGEPGGTVEVAGFKRPDDAKRDNAPSGTWDENPGRRSRN